jgi:hypothetical protein
MERERDSVNEGRRGGIEGDEGKSWRNMQTA